MQPHAAFRHHLRQLFRILDQGRQILGQLAQGAEGFAGAAERRFGAHVHADPFLGHRAGGFPDVEIRIQAPAHALHHHHGLLQQHQLRLRFHVEAARGFEQLAQQPRDGDITGGAAEDRLADGTQGLGKRLDRVLRRHESEFVVQLRHLAIIALQKARQRAGHEAAHAGVQPPHNAEIHRYQPTLRVDKQIAGMHVGMEEAVAQRLCEKAAHHQHRHLFGVAPGSGDGGGVAERNAVDPFAGQNIGGCARPVDVRHAEFGFAFGALIKLRRGGGFHAQVQLQRHAVSQGRYQRPEAKAARFRRPVFGNAGE